MAKSVSKLMLASAVAAIVVALATAANGGGDASSSTTAASAVSCNANVCSASAWAQVLQNCFTAVAGKNPRPPTGECCAVVKANRRCFCNPKPEFTTLRINPAALVKLLPKWLKNWNPKKKNFSCKICDVISLPDLAGLPNKCRIK